MARHGLDCGVAARAQPAPGLLLDHRLRPDRPVPRPRRLRLRDPGHGRPDERHRPSREIADDAPGGGPQKVGVAVADLFTGMYAVTRDPRGAAPPRPHRPRARRSTWRCSTRRWRCSPTSAPNYLATGVAPQRAGNAHQNIVPYQVFEVADGHIDPGGRQRRPVRALLRRRRLRRARCATRAFARNADRVRHRDVLVPLLAAALKRARARATGSSALEAAKVPCGPINDLAEVFADPQVQARGMTVDDGASARRRDRAWSPAR